jgi:predicted nucleotidyltransferase
MSGDIRDALRAALKRVASALKDADVPFALGGSYALWAHGAPESENDVDFLVAEEDAERAADVLSKAGFSIIRPPEDWLFKASTDGVTVDILHAVVGVVVTPKDLDRAEEIDVLAIRMPVLPATDVVAAKLRSLNEHYCDFARMLPAVRAVREQLDWAELADTGRDNDFAAAFLLLADRLGLSAGAPTGQAPPAPGPGRRDL